MSMSMHCEAVKPANADYKKKAAAYHACVAANVPIPKELSEFFGDEEPDDTGTTIHLGYDMRTDHPSCEKWQDSSRSGFQVDITKLPAGTRYVRFYCSY